MRLFLLVLLVTVASARYNVTKSEWEEYKLKWGKNYTLEKDGYHKKHYENSLTTVLECNQRFADNKTHFKCKTNRRSDSPRPLTFPYILGLDKVQLKYLTNFVEKFGSSLPRPNRTRRSVEGKEHKDWCEAGAVTEVVEQGDCQSCYAFAVTGAIESHYFIHSGELVKLSEQQIVDCSKSFTYVTMNDTTYYLNQGCRYGMTDHSIQYFQDLHHDFTYAEDYPYVDRENDHCLYDPKKRKVKVGPLKAIHMGSEEEIKKIVKNVGPVAATLDVLSRFFLNYAEGVYDDPDCDSSPSGVSHAVVIVGFGTTKDGVDYWKFKNSWGPDWGMNGFGYIRRNNNTCGIANFISYPDYSNVSLALQT